MAANELRPWHAVQPGLAHTLKAVPTSYSHEETPPLAMRCALHCDAAADAVPEQQCSESRRRRSQCDAGQCSTDCRCTNGFAVGMLHDGELGMLYHCGAHCSAAPPMDEVESRLPNLQSVRTHGI